MSGSASGARGIRADCLMSFDGQQAAGQSKTLSAASASRDVIEIDNYFLWHCVGSASLNSSLQPKCNIISGSTAWLQQAAIKRCEFTRLLDASNRKAL
jgi:hypothetical protein